MQSTYQVTIVCEPCLEMTDGLLDSLDVGTQAIHTKVNLGHIAHAHFLTICAQDGRKLCKARADCHVCVALVELHQHLAR
ncbi:hypothetical protein D3C85_1726150 [compost metagenome]